MLTLILSVLCFVGIVAVILTMIPKPVATNFMDYVYEYNYLMNAIDKSTNRDQIIRLCNDVYRFQTYYKNHPDADRDVQNLIEAIDNRYYEIQHNIFKPKQIICHN